jgi:N-acetylmuramoyl-L-alanine amidase
LHRSGICDEVTWLALVEASWSLGDRWLKLTSPNARGDDVAQLQASLLRLGFDCGRPDGIFGPLTANAVVRFQRHCGLPSDGICGLETVRVLTLNSRQTGDGPGVAMLRDLAALTTTSDDLVDLRVVVGQFGGLSSLARQVARALRQLETSVLSIDEPDASLQAEVANHHGAHAYLGLESSSDSRFTLSYYADPHYESLGGRLLAERLATRMRAHDGLSHLACDIQGMRLPVLRETKMPAVLCSVAPLREVMAVAPLLSSVIVDAMRDWAVQPFH